MLVYMIYINKHEKLKPKDYCKLIIKLLINHKTKS